MNRWRNTRRCRGIATFFAVAALGLVATAVLAMTTMLRIDHRRTQASLVDAQLRQLLLSGAAAAQVYYEDNPPHTKLEKLDLPDELVRAGASVRWEFTDAAAQPLGGELSITVIAEYAESSAYQKLRFVADGQANGLRLIASEISR